MIIKLKIIVAERSSVVRPRGRKYELKYSHPSEKYMKSFGEHGVRRSVRENSHLCSKTYNSGREKLLGRRPLCEQAIDSTPVSKS